MDTKQKLHRWTISFYDFEKAKSYLSEAECSAIGGLAFEALCYMSVISYVRPFSTNEKKPVSAASSLKVDDFKLSDADLILHEQCMSIRNRALAHSEFTYNPTTVFDNGVMSSHQFSLQDTDIFSKEGITRFKSLIENAISITHKNRAALTGVVRLGEF